MSEFVLKSVKTKGLRDNMFNGERIPGKQISVQVDPEDVEGIQKVWDKLNAKKSSPFFGVNGSKNILTIKAKKISESVLKSCTVKETKGDPSHIFVDIKFNISSFDEVFVSEDGSRHPQIKMLGLRRVEGPVEDEFEVSDEF